MHATDAPAVQPSNFRLTGLSGTPAVCSALMASTMLFAGPPPGPVSGALALKGLPTVERMPS